MKTKKNVKPELKFTTTCRGFSLSEFKDDNGQQCSLQKSSAMATEPEGERIWLGCDNKKSTFKVMGRSDEARARNGGWGWQEKSLETMFPDSDIVIADRMHLTQKQVKLLLPALKHFAKTGELPS